MLGQTLVTLQSGAQGRPVNTVFIQQRIFARHEMYFAILLDRQSGGPILIGSSRGGMAIEDVARETPEAITKIPLKITEGITHAQALKLAKDMTFSPETQEQAAQQIINLYNLFCKCDATMVEINPMVETTDKKVFCADAKLSIDDNAEFRQEEIFKYRDFSQEDEREVQATKFDLNYVGLDGNIGCIVNGAGLAMATMDIIKLYGGEPANFLDVGGGANKQQIVEALKILNSDKQVKAILVNIFGGIMRCDLIAEGLISAVKELGGLRAPLVVRLQGTNVDLAKEYLKKSGIKIIAAEDLDDAAQKACALIQESGSN
jgi:succinyl-CoA synthetase beta subunit